MRFHRAFRRGITVPANRHTFGTVNLAVAIGTNTTTAIATASTSDNGIGNVETPSVIKAVYIDGTFNINDAELAGPVYWALYKDSMGLTGTLDPQTFNAASQNAIIAHGQGLPGKTSSGTPYRIVGWFKIPKRHQRMTTGDILKFSWKNSVAVSDACYKFVFKARA